jgi:YbgC/YbaW family acyl-CoA thioester hydrolase
MPSPSNPLTIDRRIEFSQTDAAGLMHFSTYFIFMEAAEAELFRRLGIRLLWAQGEETFGFPRVDCQCSFRQPLAFDDPVRIELAIEAVRANRIHYRFSFHGPEDRLCAEGSMVTACVAKGPDGRLRPIPLPEMTRKQLEDWKNRQG